MTAAVITGASAGLGAEFTRQLVREFPDIEEFWLIARRVGKLEELAQQFPENIDNRIKLETRITARGRLNVIQPAGDRLTMKIGHRCQLIDIEAKVFQFVIHDDEQ